MPLALLLISFSLQPSGHWDFLQGRGPETTMPQTWPRVASLGKKVAKGARSSEQVGGKQESERAGTGGRCRRGERKRCPVPPLPGVATRLGCSSGDRTRRCAPPSEQPALLAPPGGRRMLGVGASKVWRRSGRGRGAAPSCPFCERRGGGGGVPQPRSCDSLEARAAGVSGVAGTITKRSQESASLPQPPPPPPLQLETGPGERRQLRRGRQSGPRPASQPPGLRSRPLGPAACPRVRRPCRAAAAETKLFPPQRPPTALSSPLRAARHLGETGCQELSSLLLTSPLPSRKTSTPGWVPAPGTASGRSKSRPPGPLEHERQLGYLKGQSPACAVLPSPLGLSFPRTEKKKRGGGEGNAALPTPPPPAPAPGL